MKVQITQDVSEGYFIVGNIYSVVSSHGLFVYATDENGSIEAVYSYQFTEV